MASRFSSSFKKRILGHPFLDRPSINFIRRQSPIIRQTSFIFFGFVTWLPALIFFNNNVGEVAWIYGASMYPYLNLDVDRSLRQDACWRSKWGPLDGLRRGMIVTFWSPLHPEVEVVKRVIGLEGDIVYTRSPYPYPTAKVPEGHIWVEGDGGASGKQSLDSNTYGPVSMSLVTGKITHVLWPWASFGRVNYEDWRGKTKVIKAKAKRQEPLHWS